MRSSYKKTVIIIASSVLCSLIVLLLIVVVLDQWIGMKHPGNSILRTQLRISKGAETEIRFRGRVVGEDGTPLADANVDIILESNRGAQGTTGLNAIPREISLKTDSNGEFLIEDSCRMLRIKTIDGPGEWLYDESGSQRNPYVLSNKQFGFAKYAGNAFYIPDETSPAVFVLVRPGHVINAWPSRGGVDGYTTGRRYVNAPLVPERPSIPLTQTNAGWVYQP